MKKMKLKKPCSKCGKVFIPTGKACKICDKCIKESRNLRKKGEFHKKIYLR